ncbi:DUF1971 domain-containing protein [Brevundimonas naejangsanensis]|uniref:DUF1971 domain-containing protein n=1 Tax=Brevundimonas naejangsanensis TaxID=588932 RepID=A0A494RF43_9CAUL|nr:DUF1971 domain-containing protein [Brevundimonas naejangsanensis]AYG94938.1 DUF1971 domain-containing protein [Brevundimonas naejangsanensis]
MNGPSQSQERPPAAPSEVAPPATSSPAPYRSTPVFDEASLPAALRSEHSLKAGAWGLIHVLEGRLRLTYRDPHMEVVLSPGTPGRIGPQQIHFVEPLGPIKMRVDFYDRPPDG